MLTLRPTLYAFRWRFGRNIEAVKGLEELVTVEGTAGKRLDDFLNLNGDDVAIYKVRILKYSAEKAFGQKMLHEHLINDLSADLRVKRLAAQFGKRIKGRNKFLIELIFPFSDRQQCPCQFGHALLKLLYRLLEGCNVRLGVGEELGEKIDDLF